MTELEFSHLTGPRGVILGAARCMGFSWMKVAARIAFTYSTYKAQDAGCSFNPQAWNQKLKIFPASFNISLTCTYWPLGAVPMVRGVYLESLSRGSIPQQDGVAFWRTGYDG